MKNKPTSLATSAARTRGEELVAEIARKKTFITEAFVDIGTALLELERKKLFKALGCSTFAELLEEKVALGKSQAFKLMAIARSLPRRHALELGPEKAYALVRYARATAKTDFAVQLVETGIQVGGKTRPLNQLTVSQINEEASRTSRNRRNAQRDPERHAAHALVDETQARLGKRGVRMKTRLRKARSGWRAIVDIPVDDFASLR